MPHHTALVLAADHHAWTAPLRSTFASALARRVGRRFPLTTLSAEEAGRVRAAALASWERLLGWAAARLAEVDLEPPPALPPAPADDRAVFLVRERPGALVPYDPFRHAPGAAVRAHLAFFLGAHDRGR